MLLVLLQSPLPLGVVWRSCHCCRAQPNCCWRLVFTSGLQDDAKEAAMEQNLGQNFEAWMLACGIEDYTAEFLEAGLTDPREVSFSASQPWSLSLSASLSPSQPHSHLLSLTLSLGLSLTLTFSFTLTFSASLSCSLSASHAREVCAMTHAHLAIDQSSSHHKICLTAQCSPSKQ